MQNKLKLVSWNVNGLRACLQKGFRESMLSLDADIICLQEIKMREGQADPELTEYHAYYNSAERAGYSGTALFSRPRPLSVTKGMGLAEHDTEGRVITAEYPSYYVTTVYTPNSKNELLRLDYRMEWEDAFRGYLSSLAAVKPVIVCGDLNVAHNDIDLKNPKQNRRNAGFTDEERGKLDALLASGFCDSYRLLYPHKEGVYTWWSYRLDARARNTGWRIDYFLVSDTLRPHIREAEVHSDILGSDHCPVTLTLEF